MDSMLNVAIVDSNEWDINVSRKDYIKRPT